MTVYEAKTLNDFKKIVAFLKTQKETLTFKCFQQRFKEMKEQFFVDIVKENPQLRIRYVEDEEGRIRAVLAYELRHPDYNPKETRLATFFLSCMEQSDINSDNWSYYYELLDALARQGLKEGYKRCEVWITESRAPKIKEMYGDAMKLVKEAENPLFGKVNFYVIDLAKYLGVKVNGGH